MNQSPTINKSIPALMKRHEFILGRPAWFTLTKKGCLVWEEHLNNCKR